ncbi:multidrug resistance protein homolog 49-like isoform X1 [Cydia pomonella]|uniref:multidrug resistance protein homolog 49-like isoform X1 n=2 Tax=Cydia pomonella TaxID=82600 RepID=UPI002ADD8707|nr:multidrug resistance protein homolog 49-like isoform X1 [Cydia pomonella]
MGAGKPEEKEAELPNRVSYFQIFRYASRLEISATLVGVLLGLLSGGGVCYNLVQFGELSTSFVERTVLTDRLSSYLPLTQLFGGGKRLVNASYEENMHALIQDAEAVCIGMFITIFISILFCILSVALINWSALRQITRVRKKFLIAVLGQDMEWFDTDSEFNLASKMSEDMTKIKEGLGEKLAVVSNLLGTAIISICQSFPLGWELTLACLTVLPFSLAASIILSDYQSTSSVREMMSYSKAGKHAEEMFKSFKTVVAFAGETKEIDRYKALLAPAERYGRKRGLYTGLGTGFNWVLTYSLNAIGLSYGTRLVIQNMDTEDLDTQRYVMGKIISIMFGVYMATQSITFIVPHAEAFAAARAAAAGVFSILDRMPKIDSMSPKGLKPGKFDGAITLDNVTFSYPSRPDVKVLKGFSLRVNPGESVALVGSSGCGKSTILQLLQRLYDPATGVVKIDNYDVKSLNVGYLRSSLGVVGQEPVLFRGTIRDNIAISHPEATDKEIIKVATMAYAHDFISRLPNGYDTMIGERGASLSGGQKQRIAIARSLLRKPSVLLLDEATSALDPQSERQVQAALDHASVGRTTLTVSHRLSTIINADRIICMDQGAIVESGTHEDLMKAKGFYYKLVSAGKDVKEDVIESLPKERENNSELLENKVRHEIKRRSTKRTVRQYSSRKEPCDWMTPRSSISSVVSNGLQHFSHRYGGEIEEAEDDQEEVKPVSDWELLKLNAPEWPLLTIGAIAATIQGACFPAFSVLFGFTSAIFASSDPAYMVHMADLYSGLFVVVAAVAGVTMCLQSVTFTNSGLRMTTRLRQQYFSSLLMQEIGYYDRESNTVGALCARLSGDTAEVQGATGLRIGLILQGVSSVVIGFLVAVCFNWKLTFVGAAFLPIMVGSIWLEGIVAQKSVQQERDAMESATSVATEAVVSIRTVQSLGIEKIFIKKFEAELEVSCSAIARKSRWRGLVLGLGVYVPFMAFCIVVVYGCTLVVHEGLPYSSVFLVTEAVMYGAYMLGQSLVYAPSFQAAKDCGARILSVIQRQPHVTTEPGVVDSPHWSATGKFGIKEAEFSYPTRPHIRVLRGLDLQVEAGKTVALVGASGCGKSTVLQLLQRFYDPDSGTIELDGQDIRRSLTLPRLRQQLGVVQQEPVLFDRTLAENIAYGDNSRQPSMDEIVAAAKQANIHNFIISLPQGYDTNLGASGAQLSGGQKQRVCIARALIRAPRLLLLDEATSALDANSERAVTEALEKAAKGRTCITIAHRLSTIKDADLICVLDKGKIIEKGTHTELMDMQGFYFRMEKGQQLA